MKEAPETFYDKFAIKLVRDFLTGNARTESAISFACSRLQRERKESVLDLGCGIGWSTFEFSRACQGTVHGLDLSSRLIGLARRMFLEDEGRQFRCGDLTTKAWSADGHQEYDACVMLDVYEHLPKASRSAFHEVLSSVLTDDAMLLLTCPTPLHQEFLRRSQPEGLQPVDEDVSIADIQVLAEQTSTQIVHFEYKSIWATNDYLYAALCRNVARKRLRTAVQPHRLCAARVRSRRLSLAAELLGPEAMVELTSTRPSLFRRAAGRVFRQWSPERRLQPPPK